MRPPTKIAPVVSKGRYIPTAINMGAGAPIMISAAAKNMPMMTRDHSSSPPMMPWAIVAMRPACGAGSSSEPIPPPYS